MLEDVCKNDNHTIKFDTDEFKGYLDIDISSYKKRMLMLNMLELFGDKDYFSIIFEIIDGIVPLIDQFSCVDKVSGESIDIYIDFISLLNDKYTAVSASQFAVFLIEFIGVFKETMSVEKATVEFYNGLTEVSVMMSPDYEGFPNIPKEFCEKALNVTVLLCNLIPTQMTDLIAKYTSGEISYEDYSRRTLGLGAPFTIIYLKELDMKYLEINKEKQEKKGGSFQSTGEKSPEEVAALVEHSLGDMDIEPAQLHYMGETSKTLIRIAEEKGINSFK